MFGADAHLIEDGVAFNKYSGFHTTLHYTPRRVGTE